MPASRKADRAFWSLVSLFYPGLCDEQSALVVSQYPGSGPATYFAGPSAKWKCGPLTEERKEKAKQNYRQKGFSLFPTVSLLPLRDAVFFCFLFLLLDTTLPEHRNTRRATANPRWPQGPCGGSTHARSMRAPRLPPPAPRPGPAGRGRPAEGAPSPDSWPPAAPAPGGGRRWEAPGSRAMIYCPTGVPLKDTNSKINQNRTTATKTALPWLRFLLEHLLPPWARVDVFCATFIFFPPPLTALALYHQAGWDKHRPQKGKACLLCEVGESARSAFRLITGRNSLELLFILFLEPISQNLSFRCNLKMEKKTKKKTKNK